MNPVLLSLFQQEAKKVFLERLRRTHEVATSLGVDTMRMWRDNVATATERVQSSATITEALCNMQSAKFDLQQILNTEFSKYSKDMYGFNPVTGCVNTVRVKEVLVRDMFREFLVRLAAMDEIKSGVALSDLHGKDLTRASTNALFQAFTIVAARQVECIPKPKRSRVFDLRRDSVDVEQEDSETPARDLMRELARQREREQEQEQEREQERQGDEREHGHPEPCESNLDSQKRDRERKKGREAHEKEGGRDSHEGERQRDSREPDSRERERERDSHERERERDSREGERERERDSHERERERERDSHERERKRDSHERERERDSHERERERDSHERERKPQSASLDTHASDGSLERKANRITVPGSLLPRESMVRGSIAPEQVCFPFRIPTGGIRPSDSASQIRPPKAPPATAPTRYAASMPPMTNTEEIRRVVLPAPIAAPAATAHKKGLAEVAAVAGGSSLGTASRSHSHRSSLY